MQAGLPTCTLRTFRVLIHRLWRTSICELTELFLVAATEIGFKLSRLAGPVTSVDVTVVVLLHRELINLLQNFCGVQYINHNLNFYWLDI